MLSSDWPTWSTKSLFQLLFKHHAPCADVKLVRVRVRVLRLKQTAAESRGLRETRGFRDSDENNFLSLKYATGS